MTDKLRSKILIADPNLYWTRSLSNFLSDEDYEILVVADGLRALQIIDSTKIDLLICEPNLPEILGDQLIKLIRQRPDCKNLPIIIYTNLPREMWEEECKNNCQHGFLKYEVNVGDVAREIQKFFKR